MLSHATAAGRVVSIAAAVDYGHAGIFQYELYRFVVAGVVL